MRELTTDMTGKIGQAGFYGKLPWKGDFVQRHLPVDWVETWDAYICGLMQSDNGGSQTFGGSRCFLLAPGCCDENAWIGSVAASKDRVGRRFPLVLASDIRLSEAMPDRIADCMAWCGRAAALQHDIATGLVSCDATFGQRLVELHAPAESTNRTAVIPDGIDDAWRWCRAQKGSLWWSGSGPVHESLRLPDAGEWQCWLSAESREQSA